MIGPLIYILCAIASAFCAWLLIARYRSSKMRLLLWSGICFVGLTLNNLLLFADFVIGTETDLSVVRSIPALLGLGALVWGLIWEAA